MAKLATIRADGEWITANGKRSWRVGSSDSRGTKAVYMREDGVERKLRRAHPSEQALPAYVWSEYEMLIRDASHSSGVDRRTIVACICTESTGKYNAERLEAHLNDSSLGLMQTLTRTARHVGALLGYPTKLPDDALARPYLMPRNSLPGGGAMLDWRRFLFEPRNSILIGAQTLAELNKRYDLGGDPLLLAASYNAGAPYADAANPWGLRMYGPHVDTFAGFWTIAAEALA